jgi:hypothetical protein
MLRLRCRNFPTKERVAEKAVQEETRVARGQVLHTEQFGCDPSVAACLSFECFCIKCRKMHRGRGRGRGGRFNRGTSEQKKEEEVKTAPQDGLSLLSANYDTEEEGVEEGEVIEQGEEELHWLLACSNAFNVSSARQKKEARTQKQSEEKAIGSKETAASQEAGRFSPAKGTQ